MSGHASLHGSKRWAGASVEGIRGGEVPHVDASSGHGGDEAGGGVEGEA